MVFEYIDFLMRCILPACLFMQASESAAIVNGDDTFPFPLRDKNAGGCYAVFGR